MRMDFDHQHHIVSVWLAGDEQAAVLEPLYRQYQGTKYRVAVFHSGGHDLTECTKALLLGNRR